MDNIRMSQFSQRPSESFIVNRSFISTTFTTEGAEDLRKSKIVNLPNYKKLNLSENLPFVVVFQTIEIERLSSQIESNRIKIKDFERQIFNAQNYEVQIRELTEKCFAYELDRGKYSEENEKMNIICHQLYNQLEEMKKRYSQVDFTLKDKYEIEKARCSQLLLEIERWKSRYMAAEKSKAKELDDLRLMMESQRKSMLDRQMRELTLKFQSERGNLENQIRKLRETIEYKNRELDDSKQKLQRTDIVIMELRSNVSQISEYENRLAMLSQQTMRLNELLKNKQDEIDQLRQREHSLQIKIKEQSQWQYDIKQLRSNADSKQRQIEEWRVRCSRLEDGVQKTKQLSVANAQMTSRLNLASSEIDRMNGALRGKLQQIEQWKQRVASQEYEVARYKNLQKDIDAYENKIAMLTQEIQRQNAQLKNRLNEVEDWRSKCTKFQTTINSYVVFERENKDLHDRLSMQTRSLEEAKHKISRLESEAANLKGYEKKLEDTQKKAMMLNNELDRLNGLLRGRQQELQDFRTRYSRLEQTIVEYKTVENKVRDYEGKVAMLTQEIQRLTNMLRIKTDDLDRASANLRRLEQEASYLRAHEIKLAESQKVIKSLNSNIDGMKKQILRLEDKYRQLDIRYRDLDSSCFAINQDKQKLSSMLRNKTTEAEEYRVRVSRLEQETIRAKELQSNYHETVNRLNIFTSELERLERVYRQIEAELQKQRGLSTQLAFKVIILSSEIERGSSSSGVKSKDFLQLQERYYQLQSGCREKDSQIMIITQKISTLESKIAFLSGELERYLQVITNNQKHAIHLEKEITQYQDYAKRIMILSAEIDRLQSENRGLEDDIRKLRLRYADQISAETKHESICMMFVIMSAEIQQLRSRVNEKEMQFNEMRKSILEPVRNFK